MKQLRSLILCVNEIGAVGTATLADALREMKLLQSLNLGCNEIGPAGTATLAYALREMKQLQSLNLGRNKIKSAGTATLTDALRELKQLQSLNLEGNNITQLPDMFSDPNWLPALTELYIGGNNMVHPPKQVGDQGLAAIRGFFREHPDPPAP
eukprot:TRINITY_DN14893_c0_g2_i1.p1 TRINITY_DN14893_c0_g2~~TRINITY_DN14893_c0_g2_i1.p1  ORF type:complete len:153 (+),score=46.47 TRINITY_DN14893_c0_g2_i1:1-459(+)